MTDLFGERIDIGETFETDDGPAVLLTLCKYAIMMEKKFFCPFKEAFKEEYGTARWSTKYPIPAFTCPMMSTKRHSCYSCQKQKYYNKANGIITKEVNEMDKGEIKEARRTPDGSYVAIGEIVDVSIGYISGDGLYEKLGRRNKFRARIVSFCDKGVELDISKPFAANIVHIPYSVINKIVQAEEVPECL